MSLGDFVKFISIIHFIVIEIQKQNSVTQFFSLLLKKFYLKFSIFFLIFYQSKILFNFKCMIYFYYITN